MLRVKLFQILVSIAIFVLKQCWHTADHWITVHGTHCDSATIRINRNVSSEQKQITILRVYVRRSLVLILKLNPNYLELCSNDSTSMYLM